MQIMKTKLTIAFGLYLILSTFGCDQADEIKISVWLTHGDQSVLYEDKTDEVIISYTDDQNLSKIEIDPSITYQEIEGYGYTMTGGSAIVINQMDKDARAALLDELFLSDGDGIGVSYIRLSIGASDLDPYVFSYNDLPEGETDEKMEHFSLDPDRENLIPVMKEVLERFPEMKILGSPWSPPTWMKTNNHTIGGSLMPEYYDAYALYFVKYIQGMAEEGITIDAITVQNEPLHPGNNPSLSMKAAEQATFIKNHLGPTFEEYDIDTKILIYDHNLDRIDYPLEVLADPEARKYIAGTAFHLYGGVIDSMSVIHEKYPDKKLYFTEQWTGVNGDFDGDLSWHLENLIVGASRNWSRNVLEWNLASDPDLRPYTDGGCSECLGALTIDGNNVQRNVSYYIIAHASKFVRPGAVRIYSTEFDDLHNVAFKNLDDSIVLIVHNGGSESQTFEISSGAFTASTILPSGSVGTYVLN